MAIEIERRGNHRIINGNGANSHYCAGRHQLLFDADARLPSLSSPFSFQIILDPKY